MLNNTNKFWIKQFSKSFNGNKTQFFNPIRRIGIAYFSFQALSDLGTNQWHSIDTILQKMKEQMSSVVNISGITCWNAYCERAAKEKKDVSCRISNVLTTLQCIYGNRLLEMKCRVDIRRENTNIYLRLNTNSIKPIKERKVAPERVQERSSTFSKAIKWVASILAIFSH
jgi:hypothetical protein